MTDQPFDRAYWGPGGIKISAWDQFHCRRGADYHETGAPVESGRAGTVRKISTGRKKGKDGKRGTITGEGSLL
jgi:hypothetical protein